MGAVKQKAAREPLSMSDERMRLALAGTDEGIWDWDAIEGAISLDDNWIRILGYEPGERTFDFDWWEQRIHPDSRTTFEKALNDYLEGRNKYYELEYRIKTKSGDWRWVWARGICVEHHSDGRPRRFIGTHRDITGRKETEAALKASEHRYQLLFENMLNGFAYCRMLYKDGTPHDFVYLDVNRAFEELTGLKDVVGKRVTEVIPGIREETKELFDIYAGVAETARPEQFDFNFKPLNIWLKISVYSPEKGYFVAVFENITEGKLAEEALRKSESRYRSLVDSLQEGIWTIDEANITSFVNVPMARMLGYKAEEMLGRHLFSFMDERGVNIAKKLLARRREGFQEQHEFEFRKKDGSRIYALIETSPLTDKNGQYRGAVAGVVNITERKQNEKVLRKSEEKYRVLLTVASQAGQAIVLLQDRDQMQAACVLANKAASVITGYGEEELLCMSWLEMVAPSERETVLDRYRRRMLGESFHEPSELPVLRKNGKVLNVELAAVKTEFQGKEAIAVLFRDIEERRESEEALRESEARFRLAFENANDGVCLVAVDGRLLQVNRRMCEILGYSKKELEQMTVNDIAHPDDAAVSPRFMRQTISGKAESSVFEKRYIHKQGHMIYGQVSSSLVRDSRGEPVYFISHVQDITLRKQAEAERERLLLAIEQTGEIVVITDTEGTIQYVNPAFEKTTGFSRGEALGKNPRILKSGIQSDAFYREMYRTISNGKTFKDRMVNKRKDGSIYTEDVTVSPVFDASRQIVAYVAVKRDVTEHLRSAKRKAELEEQFHQAQKLESVGRLAGGVAHDLNNLLSPILGFGEMLLDEFVENDERKDSVKEIVDAGRRARDLVRQLLAFSRKQVLETTPINLNELLAHFENLLRRTIREDIDLKILQASALPPIQGDTGQLEQVIMNLAVNAQDVMPNGGLLCFETLETTVGEADAARHEGMKPGRYVLLNVSDTGSGMDEETLKQLFEPFFTTKEKGKGTGLGLSTVYGIIKQHGGNIRVDSEPDEGTVFRVYLPVSEHKTDTIREIPAVGPTDLSGSETILVVEDSGQVRNLVQAVLKRQGYRVLVAENGKEALRVIESHEGPVRLLLTDVVMPGMSGKELFREISRRYPDVAVIYMSGYTDNIIAHKGILDEGVHFIQKPFNVKALAAKVRKVLDQGKVQ